MYFSTHICESRVYASWLISVAYFTLLICFAWFLFPELWKIYPVEVPRASIMASVNYAGSGPLVMPNGIRWVLEPGYGSWEPIYCGSSFQASVGRVTTED